MSIQNTHKLVILPHLIKWLPKSPKSVRSVISFDLDHTVIKPKAGRFSRNSDDWMFMEYTDVDALTYLSQRLKSSPEEHLVFFSNQGGVVSEPKTSKSCTKHVDKISKVLKRISDIDIDICDRIWIYCATKQSASLFPKKKPSEKNSLHKITKASPTTQKKIINGLVITPELFSHVRKPNRGMFDEFVKDAETDLDAGQLRFYCGDAAGRKGDFSDSDKLFAEMLGVPFKIPEEYFSEEL